MADLSQFKFLNFSNMGSGLVTGAWIFFIVAVIGIIFFLILMATEPKRKSDHVFMIHFKRTNGTRVKLVKARSVKKDGVVHYKLYLGLLNRPKKLIQLDDKYKIPIDHRRDLVYLKAEHKQLIPMMPNLEKNEFQTEEDTDVALTAQIERKAALTELRGPMNVLEFIEKNKGAIALVFLMALILVTSIIFFKNVSEQADKVASQTQAIMETAREVNAETGEVVNKLGDVVDRIDKLDDGGAI